MTWWWPEIVKVLLSPGISRGPGVIHVSSTGLTATDSGILTVTGGAVSKFRVSGYPGMVTAGSGGSVTVTATDSQGNTVTGYAGTVRVTSTDSQAVLPADYTFVSGDNGVHSLGVTLRTAGTQAISVSDSGNSSVTGVQSGIMVSAGATTRLVITSPAPAVTAGVTAGTIVVERRDQYGNVNIAETGLVVNLSSNSAGIIFGTLLTQII